MRLSSSAFIIPRKGGDISAHGLFPTPGLRQDIALQLKNKL